MVCSERCSHSIDGGRNNAIRFHVVAFVPFINIFERERKMLCKYSGLIARRDTSTSARNMLHQKTSKKFQSDI